MGTFSVDLDVSGPGSLESETVRALVDTGATYTVLPESLLRRLGVEPHTRAEFLMADGRRTEHDIGRAWVRLDGQREYTLVEFGARMPSPFLVR
jgi:predicted aspartyl protease